MTEPVAYYKDFSDGTRLFLKSNELCDIDNSDNLIKPLYTAENLHLRVQMTQTEFDEWKDLYNRSVMFSEAIEITDLDYSYNYENIKKKIWVGNRENNIENEAIFARLYADFNPEHPEETIKIVPEMKWFVVVTNPIVHAGWTYLSVDGIKRISYDAPKSEAKKFDTKEKAEEWLNPLTEAVQLPVEEQQ